MDPLQIATVILLFLTPPTLGIIGYDCGGQRLNIATISLLQVAPCDLPNQELMKSDIKLQVLQLSTYTGTSFMSCKVEIDRTIYYCGMHSHISVVPNKRYQYLMEVPPYLCKEMQITGIANIFPTVQITGLIRNHTNYRNITLAGGINVDGTCRGDNFSDPYGTWYNVVVQATFIITLTDGYWTAKLFANDIILSSEIRCPGSKGECIESDGSTTVWSPIPQDDCHFKHYNVLYEGKGLKMVPENNTGPTVYNITADETIFAFVKTAEFPLCGNKLIQTEHPRLFILEITNDQTFKAKTRINFINLDIFAYEYSKLVYVEKQLRSQSQNVYKNVMKQKCQLQQQELEHALSIATINPDEFAYLIMQGPGFVAFTYGEVAHIVKCVPVQCRVRHTDSCYLELPVYHRNESWFLSPKSHILTKTAHQRECNAILPIIYRIDGLWYSLTPKPVETIPPPSIQPLMKNHWRDIGARRDLYSEKDLQTLGEIIMFPVEKFAVLDKLARKVMGISTPVDNIVEKEGLAEIGTSVGQRIWEVLVIVGSVIAGVIGIILIIRLIKVIIGVIIHGYHLHSIYGWSFDLLAAIFGFIAQLLLQRKKPSNEPPQDPESPSNPECSGAPKNEIPV